MKFFFFNWNDESLMKVYNQIIILIAIIDLFKMNISDYCQEKLFCSITLYCNTYHIRVGFI